MIESVANWFKMTFVCPSAFLALVVASILIAMMIYAAVYDVALWEIRGDDGKVYEFHARSGIREVGK